MLHPLVLQRKQAGYHTHVLTNLPEDTDVMLVLTRQPRVPEYVGAGTYVFAIGYGRKNLRGGSTETLQWKEERRVILNYENPAARELGESTRSNHDGVPYNVDCPTCAQSPSMPYFEQGISLGTLGKPE